MFKLNLFDRKGVELKEGDILKVSDGKNFNFYSELKYLESEQAIAPFHTFSFHSFEKVDKVPDNAILSTEPRYNIWYLIDSEPDEEADNFKGYLMSWKECEVLLNKNVFRISKL